MPPLHCRKLCTVSKKSDVKVPKDPYRHAEFREEARIIMAKHGDRRFMSVDTAGSITRLAESSYKRGYEDGVKAAQAGTIGADVKADMTDFRLIPPRPRSAMWTICFSILGDNPSKIQMQDRANGYLKYFDEYHIHKWYLYVGNANSHTNFGKSTVDPLVRVGLIERFKDKNFFLISEKGVQSYYNYLVSGGRYGVL